MYERHWGITEPLEGECHADGLQVPHLNVWAYEAESILGKSLTAIYGTKAVQNVKVEDTATFSKDGVQITLQTLELARALGGLGRFPGMPATTVNPRILGDPALRPVILTNVHLSCMLRNQKYSHIFKKCILKCILLFLSLRKICIWSHIN